MGDTVPKPLQLQDQQDFLTLIRRNPINSLIIERLPELGTPDTQLVAGSLVQTVWNCLSGKRPEEDILDYDVFYYDPSDLGWDAEDAAIRRARAAFADLGIEVQVRNQARVHLWYQQKFGIQCPPLEGVHDGIDHFLNQSSCFGVSQHNGETKVYAPFGFADLFSMTVRPNCRRNLPEIYYRKAQRWREAWPRLRVMEWPDR